MDIWVGAFGCLNNAAINILLHVLQQTCICISVGYIPKGGIATHLVSACPLLVDSSK